MGITIKDKLHEKLFYCKHSLLSSHDMQQKRVNGEV
jgi:hypothetical protein